MAKLDLNKPIGCFDFMYLSSQMMERREKLRIIKQEIQDAREKINIDDNNCQLHNELNQKIKKWGHLKILSRCIGVISYVAWYIVMLLLGDYASVSALYLLQLGAIGVIVAKLYPIAWFLGLASVMITFYNTGIIAWVGFLVGLLCFFVIPFMISEKKMRDRITRTREWEERQRKAWQKDAEATRVAREMAEKTFEPQKQQMIRLEEEIAEDEPLYQLWREGALAATGHNPYKVDELMQYAIRIEIPCGSYGDLNASGTSNLSELGRWFDYSNSDVRLPKRFVEEILSGYWEDLCARETRLQAGREESVRLANECAEMFSDLINRKR